MTETFYDLLGVADDASTAEIERAYRARIKEVHPDVSDDGDAAERTMRLNRAREVLTDDAERSRYDRLGHATYTGQESAAEDSTARACDRADNESAADAGPSPDNGPSPDETAEQNRTAGKATGTAGAGNAWKRSGSTDRGRADRGSTASASSGVGGGSTDRTGQTGARASRSARRQAAAGSAAGPNVDASWNAWGSTGAWAVRRDAADGRRLGLSRLFPVEQSLVLLFSTFLLYPVFVVSALYPPFPLVARLLLVACTLFVIVYLLSLPEAGLFVFGVWGLVAPVALLLAPGLGIFSLVGVVSLTATWIPFGFAVLTLATVEY